MPHQGALDWLTQHANHDGAWPYRLGGPSQGEPTLLAVAAGAPEPRVWLDTADLGWAELLLPAAVGSPARPTTTDGGLAVALAPEQLASINRRELALQRILVSKGEAAAVPGDFDGQLIGWSWVEGTFSWVQPTAWAMLSLRLASMTHHPRYEEGLALLLDRQCEDGGWNHGNPDTLGQELTGYLYLTGWVLLVLPPGTESAERGLAFLEGVRRTPSTTNLALAVLARLAHGLDPAVEHELLVARQQADGSFGEAVERTAVAACALRAVERGDCPLVADVTAEAQPRGIEAERTARRAAEGPARRAAEASDRRPPSEELP